MRPRRHRRGGGTKISLQQVLHGRKAGVFYAVIVNPDDDSVIEEIELYSISEGEFVELTIEYRPPDGT